MKVHWKNCSEEELLTRVGEWLRSPAIASDLSRMVIFLDGEMGSGKSTFVRAMLTHLCPDQISHGSPTFPIVTEYSLPSESGAQVPFYHIDLYRLEFEQEIMDSGIDDLLDQLPSLVCVEWASMFQKYFEYWQMPSETQRRKVVQISIHSVTETTRDYQIKTEF